MDPETNEEIPKVEDSPAGDSAEVAKPETDAAPETAVSPPATVPPQGDSADPAPSVADTTPDTAPVSTADPPAEPEPAPDVDAMAARIAALETDAKRVRKASLENALAHLGVKQIYRADAPKVDVNTPDGKAKLERWVSERPEIVEANADGKVADHVEDEIAARAGKEGRGWLAKALRKTGIKYRGEVKNIRRVHG